MRIKTLDMSCDSDKKILLSYFFKKLDTPITQEELFSLCCIHYNAKEQKISAQSKRFTQKLKPLNNQKISYQEVDNTLQAILSDNFNIQEELVRCDFPLDKRTDYFYIAVIGVDFFETQTQIKNNASL